MPLILQDQFPLLQDRAWAFEKVWKLERCRILKSKPCLQDAFQQQAQDRSRKYNNRFLDFFEA